MKNPLILSALATALWLPAAYSIAADAAQSAEAPQAQERVYGSQLMTQQERAAHREKMRAAKTPEELEKLRAEHHSLMKIRARALGMTLPDEPPARGAGMGPGGGMGPRDGMGPAGANR